MKQEINSTKSLRIIATGPFFELDYICSEKQALKEVKALRKYLKTAIEPVKQKFIQDTTYYTRNGRKRRE